SRNSPGAQGGAPAYRGARRATPSQKGLPGDRRRQRLQQATGALQVLLLNHGGDGVRIPAWERQRQHLHALAGGLNLAALVFERTALQLLQGKALLLRSLHAGVVETQIVVGGRVVQADGGAAAQPAAVSAAAHVI